MSTRPRTPDLDAEREVDLGRYLDALVARWWLPVLGLVRRRRDRLPARTRRQGRLSRRGHRLRRHAVRPERDRPRPEPLDEPEHGHADRARPADAPGGRPEVRHDRAPAPCRRLDARDQERAARRRRRTSTTPSPSRARSAARSARPHRRSPRRSSPSTGGYARLKVETFKKEIASDQQQLEAIDQQSKQIQRQIERRVADRAPDARHAAPDDGAAARHPGAGPASGAAAARPRRAGRASQILDRGSALKATARSSRNSIAVAGLIGLIIGFLAALFWDPIAARTGRQQADARGEARRRRRAGVRRGEADRDDARRHSRVRRPGDRGRRRVARRDGRPPRGDGRPTRRGDHARARTAGSEPRSSPATSGRSRRGSTSRASWPATTRWTPTTSRRSPARSPAARSSTRRRTGSSRAARGS